MKIFITGRPGIGKTTFCLKLVDLMREKEISCGGVISKEIRKGNSRIGFEFVDIETNQKYILSSIKGNGPRVGKYFVNLKGIQKAVKIIERSKAKILFIDELGPMELKSTDFKNLIEDIIKCNRNMVIVVHQKLAHRYNCIQLNMLNRDKLPNDILYQFLPLFKKEN